ncbi:MAG: glycosyltransferase family 4 protein [Chloroflexota bacterium]|nr:glycosyltransferase family 4 protein [Chloroflexota bacterium]
MRLLLITPKVDPNDDLFGHVHAWVTALARRVERLYVVALWATDPPLPTNVRFATLGKQRDDDKLRWLARLQRLVGRLCLGGEVDAVLAHMGPVFAVAAAPVARLSRTPLFLWYAHGHVSSMLRLAHALVDGVGTSTPEGFRIPSSKVTITGQGIDTARFRPPGRPPDGPASVLSVGRFSPVKDYVTLLDALGRLPLADSGVAPSAELVGGVHSASEQVYLASLRARAADLGLGERVRFVEGLPHARMVPTYQRATLFATCSRTGSLDKAVLEAAACGVVPLVCNDAFRDLFGERWPALSFPPGDADALAERLADWLGRDPAERQSWALELRARIERQHSVEHLADAIISMVRRRANSP